jgi:Ca2+-binding RTX toxin-like protein
LRHPFEVVQNGFVLPLALDNERRTVMSYTFAPNTNIITVEGTQASYTYFWEALRPSTLMPLDIEALQHLYGANMTTRTGNDTYTWARNPEILETLWDAGGIDTLDLANQILPCLVDLRAGSYSSIALRRTDAQKRAALDLPSWFDAPLPSGTYDGRDNLAIAKGVTIENAIGGAGADVITGNSVSNTLSGGGGNDILAGLAGDDVLNGGPGSDVMRGGAGNDLYIVAQQDDVVEEANVQGVDQINSYLSDLNLPDFVENGRIFLAGAADLKGNDSANTLFAGAGDNELSGGAGVDTVSYLFGVAGLTGVTIDLRLSIAQNTGGSGLDILQEVENLTGSSRADTLTGNDGANVLRGGLGQDLLNGLGGADTFVFDTRLSLANRDRIADFVSGVDKIVLDDDIFTALTGTLIGVTLGAGNYHVGVAPLDADDYLLYNPTTDLLSYAPTGSASANLLPVAIIPMGAQTPGAGDFIVVA